ncbi:MULTISPECIES: hypothetical protein [unclassified Marinobacter]|uniref:hypothetical protein n=1 Tax=unclassified Marinobacter TaxID=83889 RepID=UPI00273B374A|nr:MULTISPECIES: hypothetical protein [unclassified Marinobacter]MDP4546275.1 hypothetical protein [Marinobacter sp. MDS2]
MAHDDKFAEQDERKNRRFSVSANRGNASHRIRYVESGGAAIDTEECTFCQALPDAERKGAVSKTEVTKGQHPK